MWARTAPGATPTHTSPVPSPRRPPGSATRRLPRIAAVTTALLVGTLTGCTSSATSAVAGPQLLWPNQDSGGQVVVPAAKPDAPYSFGGLGCRR